MVKVLLLTNNLLADQELQMALQRANEEVYCSNSLMFTAKKFPHVIRHFQVAYFSDTIPLVDFSQYQSTFKEQGLLVMKNGDRNYLRNTNQTHLIDVIDAWIDLGTPYNNVIDKIEELVHKKNNVKSIESARRIVHSEHFFSILSRAEKNFLISLYLLQSNHENVCRENLCKEIWGEVTGSRLSQLSNLVRNIKKKLTDCNFSENELKTSWKNGYSIGSRLFSELQKQETENVDDFIKV